MVDLGTATLELEADVAGFNAGIDAARGKLNELGGAVQSIPPLPYQNVRNMQDLGKATSLSSAEFSAFQRYSTGAATGAGALTSSLKGTNVSMAQLVSMARGNPLSMLSTSFTSMSGSAGGLSTALKGAAVAAVALYAASKWMQWMAANNEDVAASASELNTEWKEMQHNIADALAPAALSLIAILSGGLGAIGQFAEGIAHIGETARNAASDLEDFFNFIGGGGSSLVAATDSAPGWFSREAVDTAEDVSRSLIEVAIEYARTAKVSRESNDEQILGGKKTATVWEDLNDLQETNIRLYEERKRKAAEFALAAEQAEVGPRGNLTPVALNLPAPTMPASWIGTVKGQYASLAEYISSVMREALYPTEAVLTQAEYDVERAKATLTQLEARRRDEGGLGDFDAGVWTAQIEKLTGLIGPGAADEFVTGLLNNTGLVTGVLGDAAFAAGRQFADGAQAGIEAANFARVIADEGNLGDGEQMKRGMEQVGSAEPLYPGVIEDIRNVGILNSDLGSLAPPSIAPSVNIGPAMAAIAALRYALLSLNNVTPAGPGGERGGAPAPATGVTPAGFNPAALTYIPRGGATPRPALPAAALAGGRAGGGERRLETGGPQGPLIQQNIQGLMPEDVVRQTKRAFRSLAVEFGGAG